MFWFVFSLIILFIVFLIVILISTTRTSTNKTLRGLNDELEAKNRISKTKEEKQKPKRERKNPKPVAKAAPIVKSPVVEEEAVEEKTTTAVKEPFIKEKKPFIEEEVIEELVIDEPAEVEPLQEEEVETTLEVAVEPEEIVAKELISEVEEVEEALPVAIEHEEVPYAYPLFDNTRTMKEFGLSKEEADDFIIDLIQQVEDEMPALEDAVNEHDAQKIEDISHMIKGSASNLGTGGISDVLIDFNTYMKTENDSLVVARHMRNLRQALKELKEQFQ